jgi:hypothetical protein
MFDNHTASLPRTSRRVGTHFDQLIRPSTRLCDRTPRHVFGGCRR